MTNKMMLIVCGAFVFVVTAGGCASKKYSYEKQTTTSSEKEVVTQKFDCESSREYITVLEFLREAKDLAMSEADARKTSLAVSKGCNGSAHRFIHVTRLLTKSHLTGKNAVEAAQKLSQKSDKEVGAFIEVFQRAFLAEYLDMDINSAIQIAHSLTTEFDGSSDVAISDFKEIAAFCMDRSELKYEKQECGRLSARIAGLGSKSRLSVARAFKSGYEFLRSSDGPSMQTGETITLLEKLIQITPVAVENYKQAFKYAVKKSGLDLPVDAAENFAMEMAQYSESQIATPSAINKTEIKGGKNK